ncbi:MAG: phosphoglycerate dehydrogenase [Oligoflexia bacterium]|nr:phosphoglycerate dehydrogenase [Oligoflexia bacterium]
MDTKKKSINGLTAKNSKDSCAAEASKDSCTVETSINSLAAATDIKNLPIAVSSRSFSKNEELKKLLSAHFTSIKYNLTDRVLEAQELIDFLRGAEAAIVGLDKVTESVLIQLPHLKVISKYGVGINNLDLSAMKRQGIAFGWTGGVNARSVSELVLSFILGLLRNVFVNSRKISQGVWRGTGGIQLSGKTIGIIGCGHIGKDLIKILKPFDCEILICDILDMKEFCLEWEVDQVSKVNDRTSKQIERVSKQIEQVSKTEILKRSDVVSLHVPYDSSTHHLIGASDFELMKSTAILINTSRGEIVDENALCESLKQKKIAGAAADVFANEPVGNCELVRLENFVATPHIGGNSVEAVQAMGKSAIDNLVGLLAAK